ncbi:MAG: ABC transporter ATP-binding protein [Bdellovibrionaceae bacterium]|nr:ABC transporter ATP-binding protein [Pseudobdellovibrionaceae bacterium]
MNLVEVQDLKKSFKRHFWSEKKTVLKGINFNIPSGVITGFLGANGAGKTTTMKCLLNLIFQDSGNIIYFGKSEFSSEVKKKIGFLPEHPYFYSYLTGKEFLLFYGELSRTLSKKALIDRTESLLKRVDLYHAKDIALRNYSKGMLQKIGFAQALIHEPDLLILDEPMSGLDPDGRHYLSELIKESAREGHSVFLSSHLLHDTELLCENLVILKDGTVFYEGSTKDILNTLSTQYKISYLEENFQKIIFEKDQLQMQSRLKELVAKNCIIEKVEKDRVTLEEYFVKNVLEKRKNEVHLDHR